MVICSRRDLRIYDLETGCIKYSFIGLLEDKEDDVTAYKSVNYGQNFLLANHKGEINLFKYSTGE